jgi:hypothetical protein
MIVSLYAQGGVPRKKGGRGDSNKNKKTKSGRQTYLNSVVGRSWLQPSQVVLKLDRQQDN